MIAPHEWIYLGFGLGVQELLVIFCVLLLLFGANKIPKLARGIGQGINEFKRGLKDKGKDDEINDEIPEDTQDDK
ncbi:MAG: twin-arginine translocase TatA/TatE family subunit [Planctomycetes bacterium]|nr:twin-arginine translocase TatA/TatE family subunit [Planctomycetota bacterium]